MRTMGKRRGTVAQRDFDGSTMGSRGPGLDGPRKRLPNISKRGEPAAGGGFAACENIDAKARHAPNRMDDKARHFAASVAGSRNSVRVMRGGRCRERVCVRWTPAAATTMSLAHVGPGLGDQSKFVGDELAYRG